MYEEITNQARTVVTELLEQANLKPGSLLVVGCSSSEMVGVRIGKGSSMEAAQAMRGKVLELFREDMDEGVIFGADLIGMEVTSGGEAIGKITEVLDYPGNSVYVVKGTYEYMIPAVKEFVLSTDLENNVMEVKLLEGMRSDEN